MSTLDQLFYKEFYQMVKARSALKPLDLNKIPVPKLSNDAVQRTNLVLTRGINESFYCKLNDSESILWSRPHLQRRKFGSDGKFLKDKDGNVVTEDIPLPRNCVAVLSQLKIGVPLKYEPKEDFSYVDFVVSKASKTVRYIYVVPKHYCYQLNQTALVISLRPLRVYYEGISIYLQNGHLIYLYIVPFKPSSVEKPYRVLLTKTSLDFSQEINSLLVAWEKAGIIFNRGITNLSEPLRGRSNVSFQVLNPVLDDYVRFEPEKTLADSTNEVSAVAK